MENVFYLPAEDFERLLEELDKPPKVLPRLRELMQKTPRTFTVVERNAE